MQLAVFLHNFYLMISLGIFLSETIFTTTKESFPCGFELKIRFDHVALFENCL